MQNKHCLWAWGLSKAINNKKKKLLRVKNPEQLFRKTKSRAKNFARPDTDTSLLSAYAFTSRN